jgi:hypothetical protein
MNELFSLGSHWRGYTCLNIATKQSQQERAMFKGIATATFGLAATMALGLMMTAPQPSTASGVSANMTIVYKTSVFPTKNNMTVESCFVSACEDA